MRRAAGNATAAARSKGLAVLLLGLVCCGQDVDLGGAVDDAGPHREAAAAPRCGPLTGPEVTADCVACARGSSGCQANGCFGGYWCHSTTHDCQKPPASCAQ